MTGARTWNTRKAGWAALALAAAVMLSAGGAVWQLAFRAPAVEPLPLPERLVALTAEEGRRLLADSPASADFGPLTSFFEVQRRPAFCGVASSVAVLNALCPSAPRLTQADFFHDLATELRVTFAGMTLPELGDLLRGHGAKAHVVHATDTTLDTFRRTVSQNVGRRGDYVLVNYQRAELGQRGAGHISPVAAYSPASDRLLILDVAAYSYPPVWVSTNDLWRAMNTVDDSSGRSRGYVVVGSAALPP